MVAHLVTISLRPVGDVLAASMGHDSLYGAAGIDVLLGWVGVPIA